MGWNLPMHEKPKLLGTAGGAHLDGRVFAARVNAMLAAMNRNAAMP
jgi:hypothetical protein